MDCAIEAVKEVPLGNIYRGSSGLAGGSIFLGTSSFTSALTSAFGKDVGGSVPATAQVDFSKFLKDRYGNRGADLSSLKNTLRQVIPRQPGPQLIPLLPRPDVRRFSDKNISADMHKVSQDILPICPNLLPTKSFAKLNVLDFITLAALYSQPDISRNLS